MTSRIRKLYMFHVLITYTDHVRGSTKKGHDTLKTVFTSPKSQQRHVLYPCGLLTSICGDRTIHSAEDSPVDARQRFPAKFQEAPGHRSEPVKRQLFQDGTNGAAREWQLLEQQKLCEMAVCMATNTPKNLKETEGIVSLGVFV